MDEPFNDPARSGPPLNIDNADSLLLSRNELEALCTKASRGAGMSWGLAEEAGYAAGWLAALGHDGAGVLARQLRSAQGKNWQDICPVVEPGAWRATSTDKLLCPIALGASLSDHISIDKALFEGNGLKVGEVSYPGLLLPFVAMAAEGLSKTISLSLAGSRVQVGIDGMLKGDVLDLLDSEQGTLSIEIEEHSTAEPMQTQGNPTASKHNEKLEQATKPSAAASLMFLNELSMRTTVPASVASRANAGGTGSDND